MGRTYVNVPFPFLPCIPVRTDRRAELTLCMFGVPTFLLQQHSNSDLISDLRFRP